MADAEIPPTQGSSFSEEEGVLVTFVLITYGQEGCVAEAVKGALSQTYSPLEIILSDDCSPDGTFDVMQRLAEEYDGPHKIILNRNKKNLGIATHFGKAVSLAQGEFIVVAAGDDTSMPERVERLAGRWLESDRMAKVIISDCYRRDAEGQQVVSRSYLPPLREDPLMDIIERRKPKVTVHGAVASYDMELFRRFDQMIPGLVNEDRVLLFRSFLLGGGIECVEEPLVEMQTGESTRKINILVTLAARIKAVEQHLLDLGKIEEVSNRAALVKSAEKKLLKYRTQFLYKRREMTFSECAGLCKKNLASWLFAGAEGLKRLFNQGIYQRAD